MTVEASRRSQRTWKRHEPVFSGFLCLRSRSRITCHEDCSTRSLYSVVIEGTKPRKDGPVIQRIQSFAFCRPFLPGRLVYTQWSWSRALCYKYLRPCAASTFSSTTHSCIETQIKINSILMFRHNYPSPVSMMLSGSLAYCK